MDNTNLMLQIAEKCPAIWQIVMFFFAGIAIEFILEYVKSAIWRRREKECPAWAGMLLGVVGTGVYLASAYAASRTFYPGWYIPGGVIFLWTWFILFYVWQLVAIKVAKPMFRGLFPSLYYHNYVKPEKAPKEHKKTEREIALEEILEALNKRNTEGQ